MTTQISADNIQPSTLENIGGGPKISNIQITNSSYVVLDDTAVALPGGYIKITGSGFASGCTVIINGTSATSVTFVDSNTINAQVGPQNAGTYIVYVTNTDGSTAIRVNGITYSSTPTWVTGSTLPAGTVDTPITIQLNATGDGSITYALQAGSTLPTGLTLTSGGLLSGTIPGLDTETTYNFTIEAIDNQSQESPRAFSITITVGDRYWSYVTTLLSPALTALPFNDDASINNFAVTINGDTKPNNFNPYTPGYYSAYFDGTGDYLNTPTGPDAFNFSTTKTMTFECWVNADTWGATTVCFLDIVESQPFRFVYIHSSNSIQWHGNGGGIILSGTVTLAINTWHHLAFTRNADTLYIFVNGVQVATGSYTSNWQSTPAGSVFVGCNRGDTWFVTGSLADVRLVKGTAVYTSNFTPPVEPLAAITGTSLLTCQSNRFIDSSTNNFTITRNGNTRISGFDPYIPNTSYSTYGSTYFNGTDSSLTAPANTAFQLTGDFTVEAWIYPTALSSTANMIIGSAATSATDWFGLIPTQLQIVISNSSTNWNYAFSTNVWYHVAVARSGTNLTAYVNGVSLGAQTRSEQFLNTGFGVMVGRYGFSAAFYFTGHIVDARVVKGTAVYTANFTPPTSPLTAITNTSLLTCQSNQPVNNNTFLDSSTNGLPLTRAGNVTQGTLSPYGENWSNYFDGTGDYLSLTGTSATQFGSENFTIECWVYAGSSGQQSIYGDRSGASFSGMVILLSNYYISLLMSQGSAWNINTFSTNVGTQIPANTWTHVAIVRSGTSVNVYTNGTLNYTQTFSGSLAQTSTVRIGAEAGDNPAFNGYISNFRMVKGTAVYTANFTPSTTPLQPIAGTVLLTCKDNAFVDDGPNNFTITRNGDVSAQKFGPFAGTTLPTLYYSAYFDGSGDSLSVPSNTAFALGTGDFTIECWLYYIVGGSGGRFIIDSNNGSNMLFRYNVGATLEFYANSSLKLSYVVSLANAWNHVAVTRSGSAYRLFLNGALVATGTGTENISSSANPTIGSQSGNSTSDNFSGYISNLRVIKGTAVYTSAFTPPTTPLTAITNTSLLTCQSSTFVDNSTNNFTVTATGNTRPTTLSPFPVTYSTGQSYTPSMFGGSMYFDGTGDYLTATGTSNSAIGTGNFTIEGWIYGPNLGTWRSICVVGSSGDNGVYLNTANRIVWYEVGNQAESAPLIAGTWNHFAVTRSGTTLRVFLNGVKSVTDYTTSTNYSRTTLNIGANGGGSELYTGYLSSFRIVRGTALYTSNFVPSNAPLQAVKNSVLLLNGTSAGIYDSSEQANFETLGDSKLTTSLVKYGNTGVYFDGTGDGLQSKNSIPFRTADLTVEFWVYSLSNNNSTYPGMFDCRSSGSDANGFSVYYDNFGTPVFNLRIGGASNTTPTGNVPLNQWNHVAVCRVGTTMTCYINGISRITATGVTNDFTRITHYVGSTFDGYVLNGYISDFRITQGIARYTTNFTVPPGIFSNT